MRRPLMATTTEAPVGASYGRVRAIGSTSARLDHVGALVDLCALDLPTLDLGALRAALDVVRADLTTEAP